MFQFRLLFSPFFILWTASTFSQAPIAFQLDTAQSLVVGTDAVSAGDKLVWHGSKHALRAGTFIQNASFNYSLIGDNSIAMGTDARASNQTSVAIGNYSTSSGMTSISIGHHTTASGDYATSLGYYTMATGSKSFAIGDEVTASGINSTAIGKEVSTNNQKGALVIGDSDPYNFGYTYSGLPDQFTARFANGYYFKTSKDNQEWTGVQVIPGGNAWTTISDVHKKENFQKLDDIEILRKLSSVDYTSWNYKGQEAGDNRHYGIMAQDFHRLFGKDDFGTIGQDTLVNPIDMIGILMSAVKGANKLIQTTEQKNKNNEQRIALLEKQLTSILVSNNELKKAILSLQD